MSTAPTSSTDVFEDALNLISIGSALPFVMPGDTVTAISSDGQTFTAVPADGTSAEVSGTYLSFAVDDAGDVTVSPFQSNQALVDQINANGGSSAPLGDTFYYQVAGPGGGILTYSLTEDLGDTGFTSPATPPYTMAQTAVIGSTVDIGGVTVDKALSDGQADDSSDPLSVNIAVYDFGSQQPDGMLSIDPAAGGGMVSMSQDGSSITIDGTIAQIDADLSTLAYTGVQAGTDSILISDTDNPTPSFNQIIGNITVQAATAAMPVANMATTIFQVLPGGNGSGQGAPFIATGDKVTGISPDDLTFTPVPAGGGTTTVDGTDLTFSLDSSGNLSTFEYQMPQSLIDQVNVNDTASAPIADNVYYQVQDGSGATVVDQYTFDLGDTSFSAPDTQPYSAPATVTQGQTIAIGGAAVAKALSSDGTYGGADPTGYDLSVSIGVFDFTHQTGDGTVALDPTVAGGGGTVSYDAAHDSVTIDGTINQINADLGTLSYTAVQTGTDYIDISVIDGPVPSANEIIGSIEIDPAATCFCTGTLIATPGGEVAVESLRVGDFVLTGGGAAEPIRWIGRRSYAGAFIAGRHLMLPVCFHAGSLGRGMPHTDLWVSPGHAILVDGCLIPAWRLLNGTSVTQAEAVDSVTYFHVELERHAVLLANGAAVESFLDDGCRAQFNNAADYHARYPGAASMAPMAARVEDGFALERVRSRVAERAGVFAPIEPAGALHGFVDLAVPSHVCGWAQDADSPEEPVALEVWVGAQPVLCLLANHYRADLRNLGLGSGCHAFDTALPEGWHGPVSICRISDRAHLPLTAQAGERLAA